jgi:hypothetical protein
VPTVSETVPEALRPSVAAALHWFNTQEDVAFEVTGILDADAAQVETGPRTLRLVLCGGDRCEQHSFRITPVGDGFDVALTEAPAPARTTNPELDPPPGALRGWLDRTLAKHRFVVVLFYRGFW